MTVAPADLERLHAWLDGDLSTLEEQALMAAMARDPALRAEAHALREGRDLLRRVAPLAAPDGFADRVLAAVEREPVVLDRWRAWRRPFGVPLEGLALAAAVLVVVMVGWRGRGGASAPPTVDGLPPEAAPAQFAPKEAEKSDLAPQVQTKQAPVGPRGGGTAKVASPPALSTEEAVQTVAPDEKTLVEPSGTKPATPRPVADGWSGKTYTVQSDDPDVSGLIQSIAAKHNVRPTRIANADGGETWFLDLQPEEYRAFDADLRKLGVVVASPDPRIVVGHTMPIQVHVTPAGEAEAKKAAPAVSTEKKPAKGE